MNTLSSFSLDISSLNECPIFQGIFIESDLFSFQPEHFQPYNQVQSQTISQGRSGHLEAAKPQNRQSRDRGRIYKFIILQVFYKYLKTAKYRKLYRERFKGKKLENLLKRLNRIKKIRASSRTITLNHFNLFFSGSEENNEFHRSLCCRIFSQNWESIFENSQIKNRGEYIKKIHQLFPEMRS